MKKLVKQKEEKDMGVSIQNNLSSETHIKMIIIRTPRLMMSIKGAFNFLDEEALRERVVSVMWSKLEYIAVIWSLDGKI